MPTRTFIDTNVLIDYFARNPKTTAELFSLLYQRGRALTAGDEDERRRVDEALEALMRSPR